MSRKYELKARAESQEATRRRITEATVELHRTVGPSRTTISAIAERAGVQRLTVYRHFPDERELFAACGELFRQSNPPPDPAPWAAIEDLDERRTTALEAIYVWYRANADMLANVERDAPALPALAEAAAGRSQYLDAVRAMLRPGRGRLQRAALGHALRFSTWRSLDQEGLSDRQAASLMAALARG